MKSLTRLIVLATVMTGPAADALAQAPAKPAPPDLVHASIEELMNLEITSASRKEQRAQNVAAAVYVLTAEEIHRSGIQTLPELLRLVPGVQVARINANRWAISVRGFNDLYSNKLLVLVDGRSIYNRLFSGVLWDAEDLLVEDIDRIEVIRGPGGAIWGVNAVNGVINIVTKSASATQGAVVRAGKGTFDGTQGAVRYGGSFGDLAYRISSQWSGRDDSLLDGSTRANDNSTGLTNAMRIDWTHSADAIMVQSSFSTNHSKPLWNTLLGPRPEIQPTIEGTSETHAAAVLGRWTHTRPDGAMLQVQAFATNRRRIDAHVDYTERIADIDAQYHTKIGARHDLVFGGGYRDNDDHVIGTYTYSVSSENNEAAVLDVFAQDEIAVANRLKVTLGSKVERDDFAGWTFQPTARAMWEMTPHQRTWAAVSQAVRAPSLNDRRFLVHFAAFRNGAGVPVVLGIVGNPNYRTQQFLDAEAGYRHEIGSVAAIDVVAFRGRYKYLETSEPMAPIFETTPAPAHLFIPVRLDNLLNAQVTGVELAAHWTPVSWWRFDGSYSGLRLTPHLDPASRDAAAAQFDGNTPTHQWQLHSSVWLGRRVEIDAGLFQVGRLRELAVPAYLRADARLEIKMTDRLSAVAIGQNLTDRAHAEFSGVGGGFQSTFIPRSASFQLVWRY